MHEINWSVEGVMRLRSREKERRRTRSRKKSLEEKAEADRKRLEEIQAFSDYKESIKAKARDKECGMQTR